MKAYHNCEKVEIWTDLIINNFNNLLLNAVIYGECRRKMKETIHEMEMSYGTTGSLFR